MAALGLTPLTHGAVVTFAQFEESTPGNPNEFSYSEVLPPAVPTAFAELSATSVPVTFQYLSVPGLPSDLQGPQAATLNMMATSTYYLAIRPNLGRAT